MSPDRSLHRSGPALRSKVLSINDFTNDLTRPPLAKPATVYCKDEDHEAVMAWENNFDTFAAHESVEPRHDHSLQMNRSLARNRAGQGARIFQGDRAVRSSRGMCLPDPRSLEDCSVEHGKESPSRLRSVAGVGFGLVKGRAGAASANGKPVAHPNTAEEFERVAPQPGFAPRISVLRRTLETQRSRSYHEISDWSQFVQEAEA